MSKFLFMCCLFFVLQTSWCNECFSEDKIWNCTDTGLTEVPSSWNASYTIVDYSRNDISLVEQFPFSSEVEQIILKHNNITEFVNQAFKFLPNLKIIDLSFNYLTYSSLTPLIFQGNDSVDDYEPIYVEVLVLSHNELHALTAKLFEHLPNLTQLYLDHNPFNSLDSVTILAITNANRNLRALDLSYCGLETLPEGFLHTLSKLMTLNLDGNQFVSVPGTLTEASKSLIFLNLSDNPLENVTFPKMEYLEQLNLNDVDTVTVLNTGSFELLPSLKVLRCNDNPMLNKIEENIFSEEAHIRKLELRNNALAIMPVDIGLKWEELESIDLRHNPWNCDCDLALLVERSMPVVVKYNPEYMNDIRCFTPGVVRGVALVQLPLRVCFTSSSIARRMTVILGFFVILSFAACVVLGRRVAMARRRAPLPRAVFSNLDDGEDVVHYVRIVEDKD